MRDHAHAPTTCRQCAAVAPDAYRRHWTSEPPGPWHVIADGADLLARLPRRAHYATVLAYRLAPEGRHYAGPLYAELDAPDPAQALGELRRLLQMLEAGYGLDLAAVRVWHSGGRGYHLTIPARVLGAAAGHPRLPQAYSVLVAELWPPSVAPSLDRRIYSSGQGRMWRLPNRRRPNGRYKVPLTMHEALHAPLGELEALTRRPRHGVYWPAAAELSPCPALAKLYQGSMAIVEQAPACPSQTAPEGSRIPTGQRNATLASLAGAMRRRGASEGAILAALLAENAARCAPPLAEAEVRRIAASIARYTPSGQRDPDALSSDPWLGPRHTWHGVPAPILKEVAR
jgi:hypothetical protein